MRLLVILFMVVVNIGLGQNMVVNPSFETFAPCPIGPGELPNAQNWDDANSGSDSTSSPDLYAGCAFAFGGVNSPNALLGYQPSRTGSAHAGIISYEGIALFGCVSLFSTNYREYVEGMLSSPMVGGTSYTISFYVSLANGSKFATANFGVYFNNNYVSQNFGTQPGVFVATPQLNYSGPLLIDTAQWVQLSWTYTATGGEQYFIIGNFEDDNNTNYQCVNANSIFPYSYYFIDDVAVVPNTSTLPQANFASSDSVFCEKQSIDFYDLSTNAPTQWIWTFTGAQPNTSTLQNPPAIFYPSYGTFPVQLVACNAAGCDTLAYSTFITELQNPPTPTVSINGNQLCATPSYSYAWYETGNLSVVVSQQQCFSPLVAGNYFVIVSDSAGCSSPSATVVITSTTSNVKPLCIHTSCNNSLFTVKSNCSTKPLQLYVYSMQGQCVYQGKINGEGTVDLATNSPGIYTAVVISDSEKRVIKINVLLP